MKSFKTFHAEAVSDFFTFLPQSDLRTWLKNVGTKVKRDTRGRLDFHHIPQNNPTGLQIIASFINTDKNLKSLLTSKRSEKIWTTLLKSSLEDKKAAVTMKRLILKALKSERLVLEKKKRSLEKNKKTGTIGAFEELQLIEKVIFAVDNVSTIDKKAIKTKITKAIDDTGLGAAGFKG